MVDQSSDEDFAQRVVVVLVQPQHPGNVGAAARAMKNMGLHRLIIVDPPSGFDLDRARWMAPGCRDLIAQAQIVADMDAALVGVHHAVAATARHRRFHQKVMEPPELASTILDAQEQVTAIVFGREDHGLSAADVRRCEAIVRIPTPEHASLNLGHAVLVIAHDLFV